MQKDKHINVVGRWCVGILSLIMIVARIFYTNSSGDWKKDLSYQLTLGALFIVVFAALIISIIFNIARSHEKKIRPDYATILILLLFVVTTFVLLLTFD